MYQLYPLLDRLRRASKSSGIGIPKLLVGGLAAKRRNPTLGLRDYLLFQLFDKNYVGDSRPEDYLGLRAQTDLAFSLNPRTGALPAWDKLTFHLFSRAFGLPVPRLIAVYFRGGGLDPSISDTSFDSSEQLAHWLRTGAPWPVFAKPSHSQQSIGCYHFVGYRADADALLTHSGAEVPVERFISEVDGQVPRRYVRPEMGYLFQEVLRPHPEIARILGSSQISGVRVVAIRDHDGVELITAAWKIAGDESDTDRMDATTVNTLLADIDLDTGRVRMVRNLRERVSLAPLTGAALDGFALPDWGVLTALCKRAVGVFPMMRIQHWDIALTDRGPCLLELNDIGAIGAIQLFGHGIATPRLRRLLKLAGDSEAHPWIARLRS